MAEISDVHVSFDKLSTASRVAWLAIHTKEQVGEQESANEQLNPISVIKFRLIRSSSGHERVTRHGELKIVNLLRQDTFINPSKRERRRSHVPCSLDDLL